MKHKLRRDSIRLLINFIMGLNFLFINIRSLPAHKVLFEQLLLEENIQAFLVNETYLTPKLSCRLPGYKLLRYDNIQPARRANGGAAIGFSPKVPYRQTVLPLPHLPEYVIVTVYFKALYVTLATIYVRPGHAIPLGFFHYVSRNFRSYIIMADINIHSRPDRQKTHFTNFISSHTTGFLHHLPKHTRPVSNSTPDIVITSANLTNRLQIAVLDTLGSDHVPIKLTVDPHRRTPALPPNPSPPSMRYDKANWVAYRDFITGQLETITPPTSEAELFAVIDTLTTTLQTASHRFIPRAAVHPFHPRLPPQYLPLIRRSRQFFRDYIRTRNPDSLLHHRQLQRTVHNYIIAYKLRHWVKACNSLADTSHPSKFWKKFNLLTGKYTRTSYPILHLNEPLHSDTDKANAFADHLQEIFTPSVRDTLPRLHPVRRLNLSSPHLQPQVTHQLPGNNHLTAPVTVENITAFVSNRRNTAPGFDGITYRHIKESPYTLLHLLALIYTFILRTGFIPPEWKTSKTLMFLKPDKPLSHVSSYRPIQLTSTLSKILEKILVKRLHLHLQTHNLLPLHQAGFRPSFSLNDQLLRLTTGITNQFNTAKPSCLLLFDLEKAFDKVWHVGLLYKLLSFRLPVCYIRYIYHFLSSRIAYVSINNSLSHPIFPHTGVPQGSALSPLLYILFVADFPSLPPAVSLYQFADDTAFLATGRTIQHINRSLQGAINAFVQWCSQWRLTLNSAKTQAIVFLPPKRRSRVHRNPTKLDISVHNSPIQPRNTVTYLGIVFDHHLTWTPHLKHLCDKARNRLNLLRRLTGTTWGLSPSAVLNTYKVFLRPVLTYGFTAWINAPPAFYEKLKILERHALRIAYRISLPSPTAELYARMPFPHILHHLEQLRLRYISKRFDTNHPLLLQTMDQAAAFKYTSAIRHTPLSLLFTLYYFTIPPNHPDTKLVDFFTIDDAPSSLIFPSFVAL